MAFFVLIMKLYFIKRTQVLKGPCIGNSLILERKEKSFWNFDWLTQNVNVFFG